MADSVKIVIKSKASVLSGKPKGEATRKDYNIDKYDNSPDEVQVIIPNHIIVFSSSFFLGLFSESIKKCGGKRAFLEKYIFQAPPAIMDRIDGYIDLAISLWD